MNAFLKRLDHVGIAVHDVHAAMQTYQTSLALDEWEIIELPERAMRVAVGHVGDTLLELIAPTSPEAAFNKFLHDRGEGIHHLAFEVDDIDATLAQLIADGVRVIDHEARPGIHHTRVAFVHPKTLHGVLTELVEKPKMK